MLLVVTCDSELKTTSFRMTLTLCMCWCVLLCVCVALCEQLAAWQKAYCKQEEPLGAFKCNVSTATDSY
jgi:hypothetical protein